MGNLKKIIKKYLNEIRTKEKEEFARGLEHRIYSSNSNPNRLFKIGEKDTVEEWLKVFRSNPNIFPKVFRVGKIKSSETNIDLFYVEVEKLDTQRAIDEWEYIEKNLRRLGFTDFVYGLFGMDFSDIYLQHSEDEEVISKIKKGLIDHNIKAYELFTKWFSFIKECENAIKTTLNRDTFVDAHMYNFGYSSDGNLKCLDI